MAGSKDKFPSYTSIITSILADAQGPVKAKELAVQIVTSFMDIYAIDRCDTRNVQESSRQNWSSAGGLTFYGSRNPEIGSGFSPARCSANCELVKE